MAGSSVFSTGASTLSTETAPSAGRKAASLPLKLVRSKACTAFCHFICGNQDSDHCSQQPSEPDSISTTTANRLREILSALSRDKAHLLGVVTAEQRLDLGDIALPAADPHPELLAREARAVGG